VSDPSTDPHIAALREQIGEADRAMLEALNGRLALVDEIRRYKEEKGYAFVDPARERQLLEDLCALNDGPLSDEGLREIFARILDLMKRETAARDRA
jgi:chorismate mutase